MITRAHDIAVPGSCRTILALWKVFGTERETTINVLQLLIGILENHSTEGTTEIALQPVEVSLGRSGAEDLCLGLACTAED